MKSILYIFFLSSLFLLSGCKVADDINKNILEIDDDEDSDEIVSQYSDDSNSEEETTATKTEVNSSIIQVETNISKVDMNESNISNGGNSIEENSSNVEPEPIIEDVKEFNLTLPDFNNSKYTKIILGKNQHQTVTIRSTPKQPNTVLQYRELTDNSVVDTKLSFDGKPITTENYDYKIDFSSGEATGIDKFQITLENENGYTDSLYIDVEVIDQIALSGVRQTYTLVTDGDPQIITITAYNLLNNPLEFEIVDQDVINEDGKLLLTVQGGKKFVQNTKMGVDFKFLARGLKDTKEDVEIRVRDLKTGTEKSIFIKIESVRRNTTFYTDLYECGTDYNPNYDVTIDKNTPTSPDGVYSADNAIYLKSTYELSYDIDNRFSTVMIFHPVISNQYSYDRYGKVYIQNVNTGKHIATVYYATPLQGVKYYIKYFDEDKNSVVCEKRTFPYLDTVSDQDIANWADQYVTPETDLAPSSGMDGTIPVIF